MNTTPNATLRVVRTALEPSQWDRDVRTVPAVRPLIDILPPECVIPAKGWEVIDGGKIIPREQWSTHIVRPGADLIVSPEIGDMGGPMGKMLFGGLLMMGGFMMGFPMAGMMGLMMATQGIGGLLSPSPKKRQDTENSPQTYGFGPIQNITEAGTAIPVIMGRFVAGGLVASRSIRVGGVGVSYGSIPGSVTDYVPEYSQSDEYLDQAMVLGEGPVEAITPYRVSGNQPSSYSYTASFAKGEDVQSALNVSGGETRNTFMVGSDLPESGSPYFYTTVADDVTDIEIQYDFPSGLYKINDKSKREDYSVYVHVTVTGPTLPTAINFDVEFRSSNNASIRRSVRVSGLPRGAYEVNTYRSAKSSDTRVSDALSVKSVTEITRDVFAYPGCAVAGVSGFPAKQMANSAPVFSYLVDGIQVRKFSTATAYSIGWTDNPSWLSLEVLTNPRWGTGRHVWKTVARKGTVTLTSSDIVDGTGTEDWTKKVRPGMHLEVKLYTGTKHTSGHVLTVKEVLGPSQLRLTAGWDGAMLIDHKYAIHDGDLDIPAFRGFAARCAEVIPDGSGTGATEVRGMFNGVLTGGNCWDTANRIVGVGFGQLLRYGHIVSVVWGAAANPVQVFNSSNIIEGSFRFTLPDTKSRPNVFEVAYVDRDQEYTPDSYVHADPSITNNSDMERRMQVEVPGLVRRSDAARHARYQHRVNSGRGMLVEFEVGINAIRCLPNDVIGFSYDAIGENWEGRCATGGDQDKIVLDQPVTLESGTTYKVVIQHNGYWSGGIYVGGDVIETRTVGGATVFNVPTTEIYVTAGLGYIAKAGDIYVLGTAVAGPTVDYRIIDISRTQRFTAKITALEYDPGLYDDSEIKINQPIVTRDPLYSGLPSHVTGLRVNGLTTQHPSLTWTPGEVGGVQCLTNLFFLNPDTGVILESVLGISGGYYDLPSQFATPSLTYRVKAVAVSRQGVEASYGTAPTVTYTVPLPSTPPRLTGLELVNHDGVGQAHDHTFSGDPLFRWNWRGYQRGFVGDWTLDSFGPASDGHDPNFSRFEVEILNESGDSLRVDNPAENQYSYTLSMRLADGLNGTSPFTFRVRQINTLEQASEWATISVEPADPTDTGAPDSTPPSEDDEEPVGTDPGPTLPPSTTPPTPVAAYSNYELDVTWAAYGAVGDGTTDDTSAIQAAINALPRGGVIKFPPGDYRTTSALVVNVDRIRLQGFAARILVDHNGVGIYFNNIVTPTKLFGAVIEGDLRIHKVTPDTPATNLGSVGIKARNLYHSRMSGFEVVGFGTGLYLLGDGVGCVWNQFNDAWIKNNCKNIRINNNATAGIDQGYANQNTFKSIRLDYNSSAYDETCYHLYIDAGPVKASPPAVYRNNGNMFLHMSFEAANFSSGHGPKALWCDGLGNTIIDPRSEGINVSGASEPPEYQFGPNSIWNKMLFGTYLYPPHVTDQGKNNQVILGYSDRLYVTGKLLSSGSQAQAGFGPATVEYVLSAGDLTGKTVKIPNSLPAKRSIFGVTVSIEETCTGAGTVSVGTVEKLKMWGSVSGVAGQKTSADNFTIKEPVSVAGNSPIVLSASGSFSGVGKIVVSVHYLEIARALK